MSTLPDHRPRFPEDRSGVAILGCGTIARAAHLPAYRSYGVGVRGVWSRRPEATAGISEEFPHVERVYDDVADLLGDPVVRIVDIATGPVGRLAWIEAAVEAGKHVLAQKPLVVTPDDLAALPAMLGRARDAGVTVAVNHNGRWAPAWRLATLLVRDGAIGDVVGVTHVHDKPLPPLAGTPFDEVDHMLVTDYLLHWIDISRTWLAPSDVTTVQAVDSRVPGQDATARNPWSATVHLGTSAGSSASLRIVGDVVASRPGCPFWIHGTRGTLRGSVLMDSDALVLDRGGSETRLPLSGAWFVDGFAGAMGELMTAIAEGREPENSAADAAQSVALMLAARESAEGRGRPVGVGGGEQ